MSTCGSCGNEEPEASLFCGNCGAPLAPAQQPVADTAVNAAKTLICPSCGTEEPAGAKYCGSCGAPLTPEDRPAAEAASLTSATLRVEPGVESPSPVEPPPTLPAAGGRRSRWIAVGAVAVLLVAGGAIAAVLMRGDEEPHVVVTTERQPPPTVTSEPPPPPSSPTLADTVAPRLELLSDSQAALIAQVRLLGPGVASLAAVRQEAEALASDVIETQRFLDGLAPADSAEANALGLMHRALAAHLAYAEAVSRFPALPRSFTRAQAQGAITLAEEARRAYVNLRVAVPALPVVYMSGSDNNALLAVVPAPKPKPSPPTRRVIDLVPLLVGIRPDDPSARAGASGRTRRGRRSRCRASCTGVASSSVATTRTEIRAARAASTASPDRRSRWARSWLVYRGGSRSTRARLLAARVERDLDGVLRRDADLLGDGRLERVPPVAPESSTAGSRRPSRPVGSTCGGFESSRSPLWPRRGACGPVCSGRPSRSRARSDPLWFAPQPGKGSCDADEATAR